MRTIVFFASLGVLVAALPCRGAVQPIPFNHRIHTVTNELGCDTCHEGVMKSPRAGLPRVELCMGCHEGDITTNKTAEPYIATLRQHAKAGKELPWVRLYELPKNVYYSHRRHTAIAKLDCAVCHGEIGKSDRPPVEAIDRTLDMRNCIACHEKHAVGNDCAWCHR
jgi:Cytochrome c7 and related cytochrome c